MPTPYDSALAAINYSGTDASADLSGNGGLVKQTARVAIELSSTITPAQSTVATWVCYKDGPTNSLPTFLFCGAPETGFANGLWIYGAGTFPGAVTGVTYRFGSSRTGSFPAPVDFTSWQHLLFTNDNGVITGYINGAPFSFNGTIVNPQFQAIGGDTESTRRLGSIFAGTAFWDSVLSVSDIAWLYDPANRPQPSSGGSTTHNPFRSRAFAG